MTNQQQKEQIINQFYRTGRIDGYYLGIKSKSKANPIKEYIKGCLYKSYLLQNNGVQENDFIEDIYQEAFLHLWNYDTDKFIDAYENSKIKGTRIIALLMRIIVLKCFAIDKRTNNPKSCLVSRLGFGSVFNTTNYSIPPLESLSDGDTEPKQELIIFDDADAKSDFETEYGFTPEQIIDHLSPEAKFVFYQLMGKQKPGSPSKERIKAKENMIEELEFLKHRIRYKS
ncbi:hypothetical protein LJ707_13230 [Mucilaginibacter sp. UR6-1]|uniref:hypothetical protein n=1 Tax=Mucilaginibacter sp. UR6-1 TaxID=1435643 RepID=UPI001E411813|nr:hypothetical protein [Mucilaginibacter sp. UR6-1]MCC8409894.1 hypothetical protein [Mucilaginibacter sp. UR6-1]